MKRAIFFALALAIAGLGSPAQEPQKEDNIQTPYIYREESLLISETDLNCAFFIRDSVPETMSIIGAEENDLPVAQYIEYARLLVNAGSRQGLKEGAELQIVGKGAPLHRLAKSGSLGRYYRRKARAEVTCLYENRAVITLRHVCNPVAIGDLVIPYKPGKTLFEKKPRYTMCKLPTRTWEAQVVLNDMNLGAERAVGYEGTYLAVDVGAPRVRQGSYLVLYRRYAKDLPPLILGLGVVIAAEKSASTVKILDSSREIRVGDYAVPMAAPAAAKGSGAQETLPIVEAVEGEEAQPAAAVETAPPMGQLLSIELLFDFDSARLTPEHAAELDKVKTAVAGKSAYTVTLRGYTCGIGREEYNLKLSQQRVEAVKSALVSQYGIDASRVESFFYGEKEAAYDNTAESERRKNRRVTLEVAGQ